MEKRTPHEKEKYQPSYETTILTEVSCAWRGWFNQTRLNRAGRNGLFCSETFRHFVKSWN